MTQTIEAHSRNGNGNERNLPAMAPPRLPYHPAIEERFGVDKASWKALVEAIFPNAQSTESVILALSYCRARKLDPFKRNVHIVPIWDKNRRCLVDTVWPGIGELRTTAFRTGEYAGRDKAEFGPTLTQKVGHVDVTFPEWCQVTVYRFIKGQKVAFAGPAVYWLESYATVKRDDDSPNEMWATRVRGQIEKCAEAAALRAAFPEEIGSDYIADEVKHDRTKAVDSKPVTNRTEDFDAKLAAPALIPGPSEGQTIDLGTGQLNDDEAEAILAAASRSVPSEHQSDEGDLPDPVAARVIMPDDADEAWLIEMAVNKSPVGIAPDEAEKRVRAHLKTKFTKPWAKLAVEVKQDLADAIGDGVFWR